MTAASTKKPPKTPSAWAISQTQTRPDHPNAIRHKFTDRGHRWSVQSDPVGKFDQILVTTGDNRTGDRVILFAETSSDGYHVNVAGVVLSVRVGRDGVPRVTRSEDRRMYSDAEGDPLLGAVRRTTSIAARGAR